jgi:hypothetical protein
MRIVDWHYYRILDSWSTWRLISHSEDGAADESNDIPHEEDDEEHDPTGEGWVTTKRHSFWMQRLIRFDHRCILSFTPLRPNLYLSLYRLIPSTTRSPRRIGKDRGRGSSSAVKGGGGGVKKPTSGPKKRTGEEAADGIADETTKWSFLSFLPSF